MKREYLYVAAAVALGGVAYLFLRSYSGAGLPSWLTGASLQSAPVAKAGGVSDLLALGTQSRQVGSPTWGGFGGGVPGMIT